MKSFLRFLVIVGSLVFLIFSNFNAVKTSDFNDISELLVPEFTVKIVDNSYDVPTTYSIDPFTGENITHFGYHVENKTLEVTIKNQPFTSTNVDGNTTHLFYAVRWKGHFEDWDDDIYGISSGPYDYYLDNYGVKATNSEYTIRSYTLQSFGNVPANGQIDFQVKAQVGYSYAVFGEHAHIIPIGTNFKSLEESNWSSTQTFSLAENAVIPEFSSTTFFLILGVIGTFLMSIIYRQKVIRKGQSEKK